MISRSFGTHDGSFHADEVTACSVLLLFNKIDKDKIHRTRDPKILEQCEYVCDVGGVYDPEQKRFDHHQPDYKESFSSAGMILFYLKETNVIPIKLYDYFNNMLFLDIDANDNGRVLHEVGVTTFSHVIANFLPIAYESTPEEMESAFFQVVDFVVGHLSRLKNRFLYTQACEEIVKNTMANSQNVLIFDHALPWMDNFFSLGGDKHPAQFVIMPMGKHWKLRGIPPNAQEKMKVRVPLPKDWGGFHEEELRKVSKLPGAIFCHKGLFISVWETKEDALKALHFVLNEQKKCSL